MPDITLFSAYAAGLLSFISPCILPIVPFYLGYMAGANVNLVANGGSLSNQIRVRSVMAAIVFSLGIITVFVGLGASASWIGQAVREYFDILRWLAASIIFLMGLHSLDVFKIPILDRQLGMEARKGNRISILGSYVVGLTFAFGWTPCVGPILTAVLFLAAGQETAANGVILLVCYGLGMTLPFVLAAFLIQPFLNLAAKFRRYLGYVSKLNGTLLVLFSILIATNSVNLIANWMLKNVPWFHGIG